MSYTVLYVTGAGHSGSTLLNLLLNAHPQAVGLCELHFIKQYLQAGNSDSLDPLQHQLWRDVAACWKARMGADFDSLRIGTPSRRQRRSWSGEEIARYREHNIVLFDCIAEVSGAQVLIDTSKSMNRLRMLADSGLPLKVVHLVRDGRGVINSYRRKYGTYRVGFRRWFVRTLFGPWTRRSLPGIDWIVVRYEDLANAPETTLRRICTFVGLEYEESMLEYWRTEDVSIGGNRMRGKKHPVRLDERWRRELPFVHRAIFTLTGSWLNRMYGYPLLGKYQPPADM